METVDHYTYNDGRDVSNGENKPLSDCRSILLTVRWTGNRWRWKTGILCFWALYRAETRRQRDG